MDYSTITDAVDFTTVGAAIITVFAAVALAKVALAGGRKLLSAIR